MNELTREMGGDTEIQSTPYDEHLKRLNAAVLAVKGLGQIRIRGVHEIEVINSWLSEKDIDHFLNSIEQYFVTEKIKVHG
jgi:hypothetical protein